MLAVGCSSGGGNDKAAPAFDLEALGQHGERVTLAEHRGTPVVLNFWASWCAPCVKEMPLLERTHQRLGDDVQFLGIDGNDSRRLAVDLMAKTKVTYPSGYDPKDAVFRQYRLRGRPTTVFIDADGTIKGIHAGELKEADLHDLLRRYLGIDAT
ncbi:MAG TPA: TlpA disulfide reductase family protein [Acidimicrobiales bacterium]|nr:TlpA disulfide reductase family protein [Acidimicrobiales bacterium]